MLRKLLLKRHQKKRRRHLSQKRNQRKKKPRKKHKHLMLKLMIYWELILDQQPKLLSQVLQVVLEELILVQEAHRLLIQASKIISLVTLSKMMKMLEQDGLQWICLEILMDLRNNLIQILQINLCKMQLLHNQKVKLEELAYH